MSFLATNNRIQILDSNGVTKLDTNTRMPAIIQTINGSHDLSLANSASPTGNRQYSKVLGNTDPTANFIYPTFRYKTYGDGLFTTTEYVSALGTTINYVAYSENFGGTFEFSAFTFLLNNGVVTISTEGAYGQGTTIQFKIYVGKI